VSYREREVPLSRSQRETMGGKQRETPPSPPLRDDGHPRQFPQSAFDQSYRYSSGYRPPSVPLPSQIGNDLRGAVRGVLDDFARRVLQAHDYSEVDNHRDELTELIAGILEARVTSAAPAPPDGRD
jgi:hypothetical protein